MKKYISFCFLGLFFALTACDGSIRQFDGIAETQWKTDQVVTVKAEITDISKKYNMLVGLRHASQIQMGAVNVKVKQTSPSGEVTENEYVLPLRDKETGEILGSAMGDMCDTDTPVEDNIEFTEVGVYTYEITHLMGDVISPFLEAGIVLNVVEEAK